MYKIEKAIKDERKITMGK